MVELMQPPTNESPKVKKKKKREEIDRRRKEEPERILKSDKGIRKRKMYEEWFGIFDG